jgi:ectoine hydroxylase-related dioxygenase (phytanoyl-CoA dioxygenase family)
MQLDRDGARLFPAAFTSAEVAAFQRLFSNLPADRPGTRLGATSGLALLIAPADAIAASILGAQSRPVRAVLFDKTPERNWALGWHQDRTMAVRRRRDVPGFTDWTVKSGIPHCVPPFDLLARMLTLRIHLDPVGTANAPLLVAPGSHRRRFAEPEIEAELRRRGTHACLAEAGDVWAYRTPILHASDRARDPRRRRVLQLLYSADDLPHGLEWAGI